MRPATTALAASIAVLAAATAAAAQKASVAGGTDATPRLLEKTSKAGMLQRLYYTTVSPRFDQLPARDAFHFVRDMTGINMIVRYDDDATGFGIDPDLPITLELEELPALIVLEQILDQCAVHDECTWQLRKGFVEVGTKSRLAAPGALETKVYPIDELLIEPPMFTGAPPMSLNDVYDYTYSQWRDGFGGYGGGYGGNFGPASGGGFGASPVSRATREREMAEELITLITDAIDPMSWNVNGGDRATIRFSRGSLVVKAPDYIHRAINGYPVVPPLPTTMTTTPEEKDDAAANP